MTSLQSFHKNHVIYEDIWSLPIHILSSTNKLLSPGLWISAQTNKFLVLLSICPAPWRCQLYARGWVVSDDTAGETAARLLAPKPMPARGIQRLLPMNLSAADLQRLHLTNFKGREIVAECLCQIAPVLIHHSLTCLWFVSQQSWRFLPESHRFLSYLSVPVSPRIENIKTNDLALFDIPWFAFTSLTNAAPLSPEKSVLRARGGAHVITFDFRHWLIVLNEIQIFY